MDNVEFLFDAYAKIRHYLSRNDEFYKYMLPKKPIIVHPADIDYDPMSYAYTELGFLSKPKIAVNSVALEFTTRAEIVNAIVHEMAHSVLPLSAGHEKVWSDTAVGLGFGTAPGIAKGSILRWEEYFIAMEPYMPESYESAGAPILSMGNIVIPDGVEILLETP